MAKKKNIYTQLTIQDIRQEIDSIIQYISTVNVFTLADEIDWKVTQKGPIPSIVATIEESIKTLLITIRECAEMLLGLHDQGVDPTYLEDCMLIVRNSLNDIRLYYQQQPITSLTHRRASIQVKAKSSIKNPNPGMTTKSFLVATVQKQIAGRAFITRKVLETIPLLEKLNQTVLTLKGGYELPESMENHL